MFRRIMKLLLKQKKKGVVVLAPNKYGMSMGMRVAWVFDTDQDGLPIFRNASDKAKWEMATGEYSCLFDKFVTE